MDGNCPYDKLTLDGYFDGEIDREQAVQIQRHVQTCSTCRQHVAQNRRLADQARQALDCGVLPPQLARIGQAPAGPSPRKAQFSSIFGRNRWRWAIPAGALAMAATLAGLYVMPGANPPASPSAIVTSFSGEMSSITILETPNQRQTIIWINEDGDMDENAV
jgi:anti-sigma factor RsiW